MLFVKLLLILASLAFSPAAKSLRLTADNPPTYEDPADCHCRIRNGKRICNSACG